VRSAAWLFPLVLLAACGEDRPAGQVVEAENVTTTMVAEGLELALVFGATEVRAGEELPSRLTIRNASGHDITDPACIIGSGRYALVPADQPDAELWLQPVADRGGSFVYADGFVGDYDGPVFPARTMHGEPLPPGEYLAVFETDARRHATSSFGDPVAPPDNPAGLDADGLSQRLEHPIRIVDRAP
jgi:hypothetical protein